MTFQTLIIEGQEWLPINCQDIIRVDHPPIDQVCDSESFIVRKAIRIELRHGDVRWTNGCRKWWQDKKNELLERAHHLESQARELRFQHSKMI